MNADLIALAARCEAAEGPDRELDCRIWSAFGPVPFEEGLRVVPDLSQWQAAYFTASLDAAMTLIDDAWWPQIDKRRPGSWRVFLGVLNERTGQAAYAATPALALCAAALKARAHASGEQP